MKPISAAAICMILASPALALDVQKVTDNTYALVGDLGQRSPENLGNNATFGVVITDAGVVLMDPGGSWQGAREIRDTIAGLTDQPVVYVVNTGGQDHRWLGNGFWKAQGATIIASADAVADQADRGSFQLSFLSQLIGDALTGTEPVQADITFDTDYSFDLGGVTFELHHEGGAHTPGDSFVWVPSASTVFTGDIVYVTRILGIGEQSNTLEWLDSFAALEATGADHVVPGHGRATDMATARADTRDYLVNIRARIGALMDEGGDIIASPGIDQSAFSYLLNFDQLAGRNAQQVYAEMEFE